MTMDTLNNDLQVSDLKDYLKFKLRLIIKNIGIE